MWNHCDVNSETARGSAFHQWGLTHPNLGLCVSGKVHGAEGVLVDLNGLGQGLLVTPVTLS